MADVVLAEGDGQMWLLLGDEHIGQVLLGELPEGLTMEIIPVRDRAAAMALWWQLSPRASASGQPWTINPLLVARMHGMAEPDRRVIQFTAWSAMLDDPAQKAIADMAAWLAANPEGRLTLRQHAAEQPGHADLQRLRLGLVQAALDRAGAQAGRIDIELAGEAGPDADPERLELIGMPAAL